MLRKNFLYHNEDFESIANQGQLTNFISPADEYLESRLHIIQRLVKDPGNTYYFEMHNSDMFQSGISKGALLIIDKSLKPKNGSIVITSHEGQWIARMLVSNQYLMTGPMDQKPIKIEENGLNIFGVATWSCNPLAGEGSMGIVDLTVE